MKNTQVLKLHEIRDRQESIDDRYLDELKDRPPLKILHIVTSLSEYDNGIRNTVQGYDRLANKVLPVIQNSVKSFTSVSGWEVDLYLILGYKLHPSRRQMIVDSLPDGVGLEVWDEAMPYGYPAAKKEQKIKIATHALARQHRFVIKDKLDSYDFFSAWEDDMMISSDHIQNFLKMKEQLDDLKKDVSTRDNKHPIYGSLSKSQLETVIPGFVRVEVIDKKIKHLGHAQKLIKADLAAEIDHGPCCAFNPSNEIDPYESDLSNDRIMIWETDVKGFGVRKIPGPMGWIALLPGNQKIPSYWSGEDGAYGEEGRPGRSAQLFANQAGIMATASQIKYFDNICPGGFLPPFSNNFWGENSGLKPQNVEFWSGGYQIFGKCNMQRIVSLDPDNFSRQLILHASNNKQGQRSIDSTRFVKANDLLGQLYTVRDASITRHGTE